jgi:hypothetical protein
VCRFLSYAKRVKNEEMFLETVDEALLDVSPEVPVPISTHEPRFTVRSDCARITSPLRLMDFSFHNQVLGLLVSGITAIPKTSLLYERALAMFPQNGLLYIRYALCYYYRHCNASLLLRW